MNSPQGSAAERCMDEMLDSLEAGILQLLRERDEARALVRKAGRQHAPNRAKAIEDCAPRENLPPGSTVDAPIDKTGRSLAPSDEEKVETERSTRKTRKALGRSLAQIRGVRNRAIREEDQHTQ